MAFLRYWRRDTRLTYVS